MSNFTKKYYDRIYNQTMVEQDSKKKYTPCN